MALSKGTSLSGILGTLCSLHFFKVSIGGESLAKTCPWGCTEALPWKPRDFLGHVPGQSHESCFEGRTPGAWRHGARQGNKPFIVEGKA